ncbi:glycosyltransferase involved in cell wall biosynthesis [Mesorhizobium soli]|uniref:glycosyltransferase family 4 protein n=1 Tax=Pseudaminobacter soli (ex Li et al. 2025) TaxID=1295366 RepID=UPI0024761F9F|nr:glycosyltransferase family 4 protein [Mesorhizobium soli]MDH6230493.1 glycosyltransferase involved in cell wall biosynthesis [Mesorhizobium soli]
MSVAVPIRVLCIVPRGLAGRGGIETLFSHVDEQLRARSDIGIEMEFLASRGDASGAGWVFHFPIAFARYAWLLATRRYDVVHLNAATNASAWRKWAMQWLARVAGVATVVHFHGSAFPKPGDRKPGWVPVLRRVFERARAIVVLGDYWRDFVARFYEMPPERFDVVANGVADFAPDAPQAREEGAAVQLLFAGNLTDAKGAGVLFRALAQLPAHLPRWRAVFAGTGDVAGFRERAEQSGLSGQVEFTGWVARDAILPLYRQADIVVLPSRNEVLPVCLLEGACAGAALVATPVGSVPDVLSDGQNGLIITPDDPESVAHALAQLIADASEREGFRTASRDVYVSRFRLETMIEALGEVYRKALSAKR